MKSAKEQENKKTRIHDNLSDWIKWFWCSCVVWNINDQTGPSTGLWEWVCVWESESKSKSERQRQRQKERKCVCVWDRDRERQRECVRERETERETERVTVPVTVIYLNTCSRHQFYLIHSGAPHTHTPPWHSHRHRRSRRHRGRGRITANFMGIGPVKKRIPCFLHLCCECCVRVCCVCCVCGCCSAVCGVHILPPTKILTLRLCCCLVSFLA